MRLAGINTDNRQAQIRQFIAKSIRHATGFQNNAVDPAQPGRQRFRQNISVCHLCEGGNDLARLRPNTDRRLTFRYIQSYTVLLSFQTAAIMHRQRARRINYSE